MRVRRGDLLTPVAGWSFDLVLPNPPYVPAPAAACPRRGPARAWDAGRDGRLVLDRISQDVPALLKPGGTLLLVQSELSCPEESLRRLRTSGLHADTVEHRSVAFGPVLRSRSDWLHDRGLIEDDTEREELVVIRAVRPE
ncbi:hypothetical protein [Streptomyces sp. NPDC096013]|uniref:hypothetical protein n=1 Tax=Streptomyces sp. NPDC096013 TaxID=3366069 RepID=UPI0037FA47B9